MSGQLRIINGATIRRLAPPEKLIGWMREAMIAVSRREVELPLRRAIVLPGGMGAIGIMPGYVGAEANSAGVKLVSLVPPERRKGSSHLGLMVLYDADGLVPEAILCGGTVTAIRTSAATANATDLLARKDATKLTILGSGEQAAAHIDALRVVRPMMCASGGLTRITHSVSPARRAGVPAKPLKKRWTVLISSARSRQPANPSCSGDNSPTECM
jgi:ornithine cyclodeaminase